MDFILCWKKIENLSQTRILSVGMLQPEGNNTFSSWFSGSPSWLHLAPNITWGTLKIDAQDAPRPIKSESAEMGPVIGILKEWVQNWEKWH